MKKRKYIMKEQINETLTNTLIISYHFTLQFFKYIYLFALHKETITVLLYIQLID